MRTNIVHEGADELTYERLLIDIYQYNEISILGTV